MAKTRRRVRLTRKRQDWALARGGAEFTGKSLGPNVAIEARYGAALVGEVRVMRDVVRRELERLYGPTGMDAREDDVRASQARILTNALVKRFAAHFARIAPGLAERYMRRTNRASASQISGSITTLTGGLTLKTPELTGAALEAYKASIAANVSLIKSIPERYMIDVQGAVLRNVQQGGTGTAGLFEEIDRMGAVADRRAALIARDQVSKATTALNRARLERLGVRKFRWIHSGGGKEPRELHVQMNGQIYDMDNPPVIDERTGERGLPGQLINCRCRMAPVVDFGAE